MHVPEHANLNRGGGGWDGAAIRPWERERERERERESETERERRKANKRKEKKGITDVAFRT